MAHPNVGLLAGVCWSYHIQGCLVLHISTTSQGRMPVVLQPVDTSQASKQGSVVVLSSVYGVGVLL